MARYVPVVCPFPNVADHVVDAVAVGLEATDRSSPGIAVVVSVLHREDALPGIGDGLALGVEGARTDGGGANNPVVLLGYAKLLTPHRQYAEALALLETWQSLGEGIIGCPLVL